jgi:hypothetical protein
MGTGVLSQGYGGWDLNLATHLHLVQRLRMIGSFTVTLPHVRLLDIDGTLYMLLLLYLALQPSAGYGLVSRGFLITHNNAPHSVGLLWTSDQLVAETST